MNKRRKLKILQVLSHKNMVRGGAVQGYLLALGLKERGHNVSMIFNRGEKLLKEDLETLRCVEDKGIPYSFYRMDSLKDALKFRKALKSEDYDVIHTHRDIALRFVLRSAIGLKLKSLFTNRGNNYRLKKKERKLYFSKKLDCTCAVAQAVKDVLVHRCGMNPDKVEVVYGSFDENIFNKEYDSGVVRREFGLDNGRKIVGNIAAPQGKKGHLFYFETIKKVLEKKPDVVFMLVGRGLKEKFADKVKELGIEKNVIFTGYRADIPEVISSFDVSVCSATKGEGLTGAVRESLALGKPVVSTDVAGNKEIVIHGKTGILVPPKNTDAMAQAIIYLLDHPEEGAVMGREGKKVVFEKCNNTIRCDRIEKIYYKVLDSKGIL
ncbi:MAG: glycosyltransferase family 1 protein [Candidatus Schekmanbacteria bacterium]|nr:MAG: glycosyltransferase family 1 protein [Candidatus Schekmanbacteria bacterium]